MDWHLPERGAIRRGARAVPCPEPVPRRVAMRRKAAGEFAFGEAGPSPQRDTTHHLFPPEGSSLSDSINKIINAAPLGSHPRAGQSRAGRDKSPNRTDKR